MAQLSRPYQIALAALGLLAAVWFLALHRPGAGSPSEPSSPSAAAAHSAPAAAHAAPAQPASPGSPSAIYHGAAPGVEGLTRDIAKAHHAVAESEQNAAQLEAKSAQASSPTAGSAASVAPAAQDRPTASVKALPAAPKAKPKPKPSAAPASTPSAASVRAALQTTLAHELAQGKILLLLFWDPHATDDVAVRRQLNVAAAKLKGKVAVHVALADQVGQYTSITGAVTVYGTPTLLVVGHGGQASTVTGLVDAFAIEQAVSEAEHASTQR